MSNYNNTEPTVIDEDIVRKAINEQVNVEVAEIARKEGIEANQVTALRLDYKSNPLISPFLYEKKIHIC